jgi:nucleoid-associated protein YgaU
MQAGAESTYIVKKGDTFGSIAMALLGSTKKADEISKANPTVDPTRMKIGTKLRIPSATPSAEGAIASTTKTGSKSATPAGTTASNTANKPAAAGALATKSTTAATHIVVAGETLSSIAKKYYGDSSLYQAIAKANPKIKPNDLAVGDKLTIPAKTVVVGGEKIEP